MSALKLLVVGNDFPAAGFTFAEEIVIADIFNDYSGGVMRSVACQFSLSLFTAHRQFRFRW